MNLDGYAYRSGEVVLLELPSLGISGLEFRIAEWSFHALEGGFNVGRGWCLFI